MNSAAELSTGLLVEAVKRVALVAERNTAVRLAFSPGQLVLEAGSGDEAQAVEVLEASYDGDDLRSRSTRSTCSTGWPRSTPTRRGWRSPSRASPR